MTQLLYYIHLLLITSQGNNQYTNIRLGDSWVGLKDNKTGKFYRVEVKELV